MKSLPFISASTILLLALLPGFSSRAQSKTDSLQKWFSGYQQQALPEKVYVHTDKTVYVTGEILWFKLYNVDGFIHRPLPLNKAAYVEIIGTDKKPVLQSQIALDNGSGSGSLQLPSFIASGTYLLRAYTNWMKNFPADYFFETSISIVNTQKRPDWQKLQPPLTADVQFFPEGGNLVEGLASTVGFKVADQYGHGLAAHVFIVTEKGDTVQRFRTLRFGMGRFSFTPQNGATYKAIIELENGMRISKSLPQIYPAGYVLHVSERDDARLQVDVTATVSDVPVFLFVHTRGVMKALQQKELQNGKASFLVDKAALGAGVSQLTLFTYNLKPVCERLYFKQPEQKDNITVSADQASYAARQKITLTLDAGTFSNTHTDLSLSVFKQDSLPANAPDDIATYLWLTSDLRGTIDSAEYYFNRSSEAKEALENLLLTQGWRRFSWDAVATGKPFVPAFSAAYEGPAIQAKITEPNTGAPVRGVTAYLAAPGERFWLSTATSTDSGLLSFAVHRLHNSPNLVLQPASATDSVYKIEIQTPFATQVSATSPAPFPVSEVWRNTIREQHTGAQAANVYFKEQLQQFVLPVSSDSTAFYGKPDASYNLDAYTRFVTMEEVMREYVTEVHVRRQNDGFHYSVKNTPYKSYFDDNPLVLLDGVPVNDINKIVALDPLKIRALEVVARRYFVGNRTANGVVSYTSYTGDMAGLDLGQSAVLFEQAGLQAQRQFYAPVYETEQQRASRLPDFRQVLYWAPQVQFDASGKAVVSFYSSQIPGQYKVQIQGITADGDPVQASTTIQVGK